MASKESRQRSIQRKTAEWIAEHGSLPLCACGCGEFVKLEANGKPNRYAGPAHHLNVSKVEFAERMTEAHEDRRDRQDAVPIEKFRFSVRAVKNKKQMTMGELAESGGWGLGTLNYYMYSGRVKSVGRDTAENFFRRIVGAPAPITPHMRKRAARALFKEQRIDRTYKL